MRGGPGAQTPGNGGMKKHNPVTVEPAESAAVRHPPAAPGADGPARGMKIFENSPAGRSNSSTRTDELFELTHVSQLKKFVHTRI